MQGVFYAKKETAVSTAVRGEKRTNVARQPQALVGAIADYGSGAFCAFALGAEERHDDEPPFRTHP